MNDEPKVWIRKTPLKSGKVSYHLRWIDLGAGKWRSKRIGTDGKVAEYERAKLAEKLSEGTYVDAHKITWAAFSAEHVKTAKNDLTARNRRVVLAEFGEVCHPQSPAMVRFGMIERYAAYLTAKGNAPRTRAGKMAQLRAALGKGVRRGYATKNVMEDWQNDHVEEREPRALNKAEKQALSDACPTHQWRTFLVVALGTGCRLSELLTLAWGSVKLDGDLPQITVTGKGSRTRTQPLLPEAVGMLRRLQPSTQQDAGPFSGIGTRKAGSMKFARIAKNAGVECRFHDTRATYLTDLARLDVNPFMVAKLAGHSSTAITAKYYIAATEQEKAEAVAKLAGKAG